MKKLNSLDEKTVLTIGRIGSVLSILMYISYIPQIINNLHGNYGSPIQPLVAAINCLIWVLYAILKKKKDWPLFVANFPGIIFGLITFVTSLH
ncbi:SemiSWEET family transporter [Lactobacillus sp. PSON]|uniref:SemiSWEET family transporter n=1 Tax=Lactobacillus sp. PSON TaxID=3455454 RepID=UPI0040424C68